MFYSVSQGAYYAYWRRTISISCGSNNPSNNSYEMQQVIFATYLYYVSKIIDLLDTVIKYPCSSLCASCHSTEFPFTNYNLHLQVFFVLRKKNNQITFLHVYHHGGMVLATFVYFKFLSGRCIHWIGVFLIMNIIGAGVEWNCANHFLWYLGSHGTLLGVINAFVHVIMYSYYFMTAYRPELKTSMWWKKHITQIQLVSDQFHFFTAAIFACCIWNANVSLWINGHVYAFFFSI